ncbi:uncharacterized protein LOC125481432 isoform X2 [Rhincodon typus]|uniref:uncharacterized protein LOC125481432 isoform X2 n=1 Tax=Rhincodon typus TaxID=259920 RepID=UPI00202E70FC|nr:uncharacterized protein LOC125481432 isoform X2 [Rhincodon typus]
MGDLKSEINMETSLSSSGLYVEQVMTDFESWKLLLEWVCGRYSWYLLLECCRVSRSSDSEGAFETPEETTPVKVPPQGSPIAAEKESQEQLPSVPSEL